MTNDSIYLALGSNLGNKSENFIKAIQLLEENNVKFIKSSPLFKTPALLLDGSPDSWNIPYLNCIIEIDTKETPENLLKICKKIEAEMGRDFSKKWSPRIIDLDILLYKNIMIDTENLTIPHKALFERYFLLDALNFLNTKIIVNQNLYTKEHQPVFMGILNITLDSFSDGGINNIENNFINNFESFVENNVSIIDIGAEATNPNVTPIEDVIERDRLKFVFKYLRNKKFSYFKPMLSIDSYHYDTVKEAVDNGFDIINDVNALKDERMLDLLKSNKQLQYVLTHSLTVPVDKNLIIDENLDCIEVIQEWIENKLRILERYSIDLNNIIFDPGIGFGKDQFQNMKILKEINKFHKYGIKILIGHSRKSFIRKFEKIVGDDVDFESLAISLKISNKVDIIRTHKPIETQNSLLFYHNLD